MSRPRVIVVKVGGSLLTSSDLPQRLTDWLAAQTSAFPDGHFVLIAGGGLWVDAIRDLDVGVLLGNEWAHWICVELMDVTAGLVGELLPGVCRVANFAELELRIVEPGITLLQPRQFVKEVEPTCDGIKLACNWSVTSDAIAGRLAIVLRADELVLLKSVSAPERIRSGAWLAQLAAAGYVDCFLPKLSKELPPLRFEAIL